MAFSLDEKGFAWWDYVIFLTICILSCSGGLWYSAVALRKEAVQDVRDYLLGGKAMSTFPVSLSLIASYVSGVTILGTPTEIYNYGTQYTLVVFAITLSTFTVATVYLPVFTKLRLSSSYEYLELRFNRHVRGVVSVLFLLDEVLFLPMIVYVPALAFNQLTGFNVFAVGGAMVFICGIYTVFGGLRAVVWTDSVQTTVMFIGIFVVASAGIYAIESVDLFISTAKESNRLRFDNWAFSPYERQTGWGAVFGSFVYWTCFNSVNQTMVQRYIALASKRKSYFALTIFCTGAILAIILCALCGLSAWVTWYLDGCNKDGVPPVSDRLLPAFVTYLTRVKSLKGLPGIFLSGVFGAGLSSLSAVLNACALVVVEDILRGWLRLQLKPFTEGMLARVASAILAILSIVMLLVIEKLGGVLGVATALSAIAASSTCGVFTLGMVCWWVGPRGAICGAIAGAIMAGTTSLGTQTAAAKGLRAPPMAFSAECAANASYSPPHDILKQWDEPLCESIQRELQIRTSCSDPSERARLLTVLERESGLWLNVLPSTNIGTQMDNNTFSLADPSTIFPLFRVSYHWIAPLGFFSTLMVGSLVGWFFDKNATIVKDKELFTPRVWRFLPEVFSDHAGEVRAKIERTARRLEALEPLSLADIRLKNLSIIRKKSQKTETDTRDNNKTISDEQSSHAGTSTKQDEKG